MGVNHDLQVLLKSQEFYQSVFQQTVEITHLVLQLYLLEQVLHLEDKSQD